jgi:hypothetical protein
MTVPRSPARTPCTIFFLLAIGVLPSCASVCVRPAKGADDVGVHYYMPKPYIMVTRALTDEGTASDAFETKIVMLPDPNQRRTIVQQPGFGSANASCTLTDGWNLTEFGGESTGTDPADLISAATEVAALLLPAAAKRGEPGSSDESIPVAVLLGVAMEPSRSYLFDERIVIYSDGTTEPAPFLKDESKGTVPNVEGLSHKKAVEELKKKGGFRKSSG